MKDFFSFLLFFLEGVLILLVIFVAAYVINMGIDNMISATDDACKFHEKCKDLSDKDCSINECNQE